MTQKLPQICTVLCVSVLGRLRDLHSIYLRKLLTHPVHTILSERGWIGLLLPEAGGGRGGGPQQQGCPLLQELCAQNQVILSHIILYTHESHIVT